MLSQRALSRAPPPPYMLDRVRRPHILTAPPRPTHVDASAHVRLDVLKGCRTARQRRIGGVGVSGDELLDNAGERER